MNRSRLAVFACLLPILAASMSHVAGAFGAYERADSWPYWGWLAAVGIDAAIALLVWRLIDGEQRGGDRWALAGVLLASAVSAQTNLAHALTVAVERGIGGRVLAAWASSTWWAVLGVLAVSITLPVLVGVLAAVAHGDARGVGEQETDTDAHAEHNAREVERAKAARERELAAEWARLDLVGAKLVSAAERGVPIPDADRLALVLAHVAAHPTATDVDITSATGVPRATVGRWRRRGLLDPPTVEHSLNGKVSG